MIPVKALERGCPDLTEEAVNKHKNKALTTTQFFSTLKKDQFEQTVNNIIILVQKNTLKNKPLDEQKKLIQTAWNHRQGLDVYGLESLSRIYTQLFGVNPK